MAAHEAPIGVGGVSQQRVDVGVAEPCALLAAGTVDEGVGRAELQCAGADAPDFVERRIVALEVRLVAARIAPLDCARRFDLRTSARDDRQIAETDRLVRLDAFRLAAAQDVAHRKLARLRLRAAIGANVLAAIHIDRRSRGAAHDRPRRRERDHPRVEIDDSVGTVAGLFHRRIRVARIVADQRGNAPARELFERDRNRGQRRDRVMLGRRERLDRDSRAIVRKGARRQFDRGLPFSVIELRVVPSCRNRGAVQDFCRRHGQRRTAHDVLPIGRGASFPRGI